MQGQSLLEEVLRQMKLYRPQQLCSLEHGMKYFKLANVLQNIPVSAAGREEWAALQKHLFDAPESRSSAAELKRQTIEWCKVRAQEVPKNRGETP